MNALRRQNSRPQQTFERLTPKTYESPRELGRQSDANVCRHSGNLKKPRLIDCTENPNNAQNTQKKLGVAFWFLELNNYNRQINNNNNNNLSIIDKN